MNWTYDAIERLRTFWAEGHATAEIGRRLGVSKNIIIGKAHRLDFTARPSPFRRRQLDENGIEQTGGPCVPRLANLVLMLVYAAFAPFSAASAAASKANDVICRDFAAVLAEWPMPGFRARTPA